VDVDQLDSLRMGVLGVAAADAERLPSMTLEVVEYTPEVFSCGTALPCHRTQR
jgi:hypothetical protein